MTIQYFPETDTLYIAFKEGPADHTDEIAQSVYVDFDDAGGVMAMTLDVASLHTDIHTLELVNVPLVSVRSLLRPEAMATAPAGAVVSS